MATSSGSRPTIRAGRAPGTGWKGFGIDPLSVALVSLTETFLTKKPWRSYSTITWPAGSPASAAAFLGGFNSMTVGIEIRKTIAQSRKM